MMKYVDLNKTKLILLILIYYKLILLISYIERAQMLIMLQKIPLHF